MAKIFSLRNWYSNGIVGSSFAFIIGLLGTVGHYGSLIHSSHFSAGLLVVALVSLSAWSSTKISSQRPWARSIHIGTNIILFAGFVFVSLTGWEVVQKYLP